MLNNYHVLKISYLGATNTKGSRIKILSERFKESKVIAYNYEFNNTCEGAEDYLSKNGFELIGKAEGKDCYYIITNTFKGLK